MTDRSAPQTIGVLVATYCRAEALLRCLTGIVAQTRRPDDVIVVIRHSDKATLATLNEVSYPSLPLRIEQVVQPGLIAARNAGINVCHTDILAMVDDDAVPHPDWLARIFQHFCSDPQLGGVGGRDRCHDGTRFDEGRALVVGKLQWFGRAIGNHHRGYGGPRQVDILKGANMSYRAEVFAQVRFDTRLRGSGSQPNEDMRFSLQVKGIGWKLLYDPKVLVDHYPYVHDEPRFYGGIVPVNDVNKTKFKEFAYNEVAAVWDILSIERRIVFALWSALVGTRISPGFIQAVRFTPHLGSMAWRRFIVNLQGKLEAIHELGWRSPKISADVCPSLAPRTAKQKSQQRL